MQTTPDPRHPASGRREDSRATNGRAAFTLVEMLVVISIISVLLGLLYGSLERARKFSRMTIAYTEVKSIETAFRQYYAHYSQWPSNELAQTVLTSGEDQGFIIDRQVAYALMGIRDTASEAWRLNPEAIPFIEFSRFSPTTFAPANPFKSDRPTAEDTSRSYKVLFDSNGDRQILVPPDANALGTPTNTPVIGSIAVWTVIPANRKSTSSGATENTGDVILGSWETFGAK